jgi:hypothetical protein
MELFLQRKSGVLVPYSAVDISILNKIPEGVDIKAKLKRSRSAANHRRFFAMLHYVLENQDKYRNEEDLLVELKCKVGHYQEHIKRDGEIVYIPKSIDFDSMGEDEFKSFKSRVVDVILSDFLVGETMEELDRHAERILGFL